jgi:hypothetical protein
MASKFDALNFLHVLDILNIIHKVIIPSCLSKLGAMWYAGAVMGILHGAFRKIWINPPPPDWIDITLKLFRSETSHITPFVEDQFATLHLNMKRISLMELEAWKNEPTPLSRTLSSQQDDRKGTNLSPASTNEKIAPVDSASTLSEEHL